MKRMKQNAGFTLVELVVVIAILGILGGVGTAGYGQYVKHAQKKADQTLVANIIRALETGVNTTMFEPPASLNIGSTTYPVGFISLKYGEDGQVLTSNSRFETMEDKEGKCVIQNVPVAYIEKYDKGLVCTETGKTVEKEAYRIATTQKLCCIAHSDWATEITGNYVVDYEHTGTDHDGGCGGDTCKKANWSATSEKLSIPEGTQYFVESLSDVYVPSESDSNKCVLAYANQTGSFVRPDPAEGEDVKYTTINGDHVLNQSIEAAFGTSKMALQYDKWGEDEEDDYNYATLYHTAQNMLTEVDKVATLLVKVQEYMNNPLTGWAVKPIFGSYVTKENYGSSGGLVTSYADFMAEQFKDDTGAAAWDAAWANAANPTDGSGDEYMFTLGGKGAKNDYIWAARLSYNTSFASYCTAHGISDVYSDVIANYGENFGDKAASMAGGTDISGLMSVVGMDANTNVPSVVNDSAFNKSMLKDQFMATVADPSNAEQVKAAEDAYEQCKELYQTYKTSEACKLNGREFLNTMKTISATGDEAMNKDNAAGGDYLKYYQNYLDEMAGVYAEAQEKADGGIMIIVNMKGDALECIVSPSSADLRNQK